MKTKKQKKPIRFELNDGELIVEVDYRGAVYMIEPEGGRFNHSTGECEDVRYLELSAADLDSIAEASRKFTEFSDWLDSFNLKRHTTRTGGHRILVKLGDLNGDGSVEIGCQNIKPQDVMRVHEASLKQRGIKAKK